MTTTHQPIMTPEMRATEETMKEEMRVRVAEVLGYERQVRSDMFWNRELGRYFSPEELPDYLHDLDAMHDAEMALFARGWKETDEYLKHLYSLVQDPHICGLSHTAEYVCATAAQRAEAFLRTVGKWVETKEGE